MTTHPLMLIDGAFLNEKGFFLPCHGFGVVLVFWGLVLFAWPLVFCFFVAVKTKAREPGFIDLVGRQQRAACVT